MEGLEKKDESNSFVFQIVQYMEIVAIFA